MPKWIILFVFSLITGVSFGQYPQDYFRSPVDFPIYLAGSFAELRSNHFHSGIDIKTQGGEGKKVYAIADGYVSRIKISPYGFGKALYIAHPNGYTSAYAHLSEFQEPMASYFREMQYLKEEYALDLYLTPGQIKVKKGEVIALSGNSGSSSGPHLHFEIRTTAVQKPVNPVLFGIDIHDDIAPVVWWLYSYTKPAGTPAAQPHAITKTGENFRLKEYENTLSLPAGQVAFSVKTIDKMEGSSSSLDLHDLVLKVDGTKIYEFTTNTFSFSETRYLNAHIDYELSEAKGTRVHRLYKLPGDHLSMYSNLENDGWFTLKVGEERAVEITMTDASGNESVLNFKVKGIKAEVQQTLSAKGKQMIPNHSNSFEKGPFSISLPYRALYDTIQFQFHEDSTAVLDKCFSPVFFIHDENTPLQQYATVKIEAPDFPSAYREKTIARRKMSPGKYDVYEGSWEGSKFVFKTRDFGPYHLSMDTTAPTVRISGLADGSFIKPGQQLRVAIDDRESGINDYAAYLDGKWMLMEYDFKRDLLSGEFPANLDRGEHNLRIEVSDDVGNKTIKYLRLKH